MKHIPVLLAFALVAWAQAPKPGVIVGGNSSGGGGGGSYTAGTGLTLTGSEFAINSAVTQTKANDQSGATKWCVGSGTASAQTCSLSPVLATYTPGMVINFTPSATNVTTQTLNIDTLGAKAILNAAGSALVAGDLTLNRWYPLLYDGTQFRLTGSSSGGATTKITDLWFPVGGSGAGTTAGANFTTLGTGYTSPTLSTNTNPIRTYATFNPNAGTPWGYLFTYALPATWDSSGNLTMTFYGNPNPTTGNRTYSAETACIDDTESIGGTITFGSAQTVTVSMPTDNALVTASLNLDKTGCSAGDMLLVRITRSDAVAGNLHFRGLRLIYTETLN